MPSAGGAGARTERIADDEINRLFGLPVTTVARTTFDVARHLDRPGALARLDAMMWAQPFPVDDVGALAKRYPVRPAAGSCANCIPSSTGERRRRGRAAPACS